MKAKKPTTYLRGAPGAHGSIYEITLRRDVQQVARVSVEASSRQDAIDVAESAVDSAAWNIEEHIGTHKPEVHRKRRR